jgi:DNA polymerase/3'-5' exonuclease PolX
VAELTVSARRRRRTFWKASSAADLREQTFVERGAARRRAVAGKFARASGRVIRCSAAGSLRRFKEIIGDIDLLASSKKPAEVIEFFVSQPGIIKVTAKGETKASVILEGGIQCDLRVVSDREFPFALAYFTGSKEHNIVMRQRAIQRGLRLNEYGLFKSKEETRDPKLLVPCKRGGDF